MDKTTDFIPSESISQVVSSEQQSSVFNSEKQEIGHLAWYWHVLIIVLIDICCLIGNGVTLYIHITYRKKYTSWKYVVSLATIDIFSCLFLLPCYPFTNQSVVLTAKDDIFVKAYFGLSAIASNAYMSMLNVTALDRLFAVCYPIMYINHYRLRSVISFIAVFLITTYGFIFITVTKNHTNRHVTLLDIFSSGHSVDFHYYMLHYYHCYSLQKKS